MILKNVVFHFEPSHFVPSNEMILFVGSYLVANSLIVLINDEIFNLFNSKKNNK